MPIKRWSEEGNGVPITDGAYVVFPFDDGLRHFVRFAAGPRRYFDALGPNADTAVCGAPTPDWRTNPTGYLIAGTVNCPLCRAARDADV